MSLTPTPEQQAITDAYLTGAHLAVEAGAGTGKTSTLKMLAKATPARRGMYLAYNKAIATDAARDFPASVVCKTAHAFAYAAVARPYAPRLKAPRVPAWKTAQILGIQSIRLSAERAPLGPQQLARIVMAAVEHFCHTADAQIDRHHVRPYAGLDRAENAALAQAVEPWLRKAWDDITSVHGELRFTHDCYLKIWALSRPQLGADFLLFDEAQDANACVADVVERQQAQRILVGDRNQSIYGWRGAVDAMSAFTGRRLYLSKSFRFGPAIADEANKWLTVLDAQLRLTGFDQIPSTLAPLPAPDAFLCRSNAGAFNRALDAITAGRRTALVGGGGDIKRMAEAAAKLQAGQPCDHPELLCFATWAEVQDYAENDAAGSDLKVFVGLVDKVGADEIVRVCDRLVDERIAQTVVSTAHKAKGREWGTVRIATDFHEPKTDPDSGEQSDIPREDAMLAYVAVTRARNVLDREGLAWVDGWLEPEPEQEPEPPVRAPYRSFLSDPTVRDTWPQPEPIGARGGRLG